MKSLSLSISTEGEKSEKKKTKQNHTVFHININKHERKIERVINQLQIESIPFSSFISKHARLNIRHHNHHNRYDQYSYKRERETI